MRSEKEMMDLILTFAQDEKRIKVVCMEGSRTNINIPKDEFQDYDVVYIVTKMDSFLKDDNWLDYFGEKLIMQKPDTSTLFPKSSSNRFTYLMLFRDGNRIDLTLLPITELDDYMKSDKLIKVLLDKDNLIKNYPIPTDIDYHIKKPNQTMFNDCFNEFWWVSTYVVKGLCRREILYAIDHLNNCVRYELLRMVSWKVGSDHNFSLSIGKNNKFLEKYVSKDFWKKLMSTYKMETYEDVWKALFACFKLFIEVSQVVATMLGFTYPKYEEDIIDYAKHNMNKYYFKDK